MAYSVIRLFCQERADTWSTFPMNLPVSQSVYSMLISPQDFLLDPYTYQYYNSTFQRNTEAPIRHVDAYSTDVLAEKAYGFLDDAVSSDKPFFLTIAPVAPHSNVKFSGSDATLEDQVVEFDTPLPAQRHAHLFQGLEIPRTEHFNPEKV